MQKYIQVFKVSLAEYFIYRLNFVLWRFRMVLSTVLTYFIWNSVYLHGSTTILSYTKEKMLSYILLSGVMGAWVLSGKTADFAGEIVNGNIINYMLKPISLFNTVLSKEAADKFLNICFGIVEIIILVLIFRPALFLQTNIAVYPILFITLIIASIISFTLSFCISLIAFWSHEVWAPRFIYLILLSVLAGTLFPLDIFPKPIYNFLMLTPFPYLLYLPTKIYLEGFSTSLLKPFVISIIWVFILLFISKLIWQKGLRDFSFYGR